MIQWLKATNCHYLDGHAVEMQYSEKASGRQMRTDRWRWLRDWGTFRAPGDSLPGGTFFLIELKTWLLSEEMNWSKRHRLLTESESQRSQWDQIDLLKMYPTTFVHFLLKFHLVFIWHCAIHHDLTSKRKYWTIKLKGKTKQFIIKFLTVTHAYTI